jgi:hypothetical protein
MEEAEELTAQEHLDRFSAGDSTLAGFSIVSVVPAITNDLILACRFYSSSTTTLLARCGTRAK